MNFNWSFPPKSINSQLIYHAQRSPHCTYLSAEPIFSWHLSPRIRYWTLDIVCRSRTGVLFCFKRLYQFLKWLGFSLERYGQDLRLVSSLTKLMLFLLCSLEGHRGRISFYVHQRLKHLGHQDHLLRNCHSQDGSFRRLLDLKWIDHNHSFY